MGLQGNALMSHDAMSPSADAEEAPQPKAVGDALQRIEQQIHALQRRVRVIWIISLIGGGSALLAVISCSGLITYAYLNSSPLELTSEQDKRPDGDWAWNETTHGWRWETGFQVPSDPAAAFAWWADETQIPEESQRILVESWLRDGGADLNQLDAGMDGEYRRIRGFRRSDGQILVEVELASMPATEAGETDFTEGSYYEDAIEMTVENRTGEQRPELIQSLPPVE